MNRNDGVTKRRGVPAGLALTPQQENLLAQLRDGWILERAQLWDDFTLSHAAHPRTSITVNTLTARSLIKYGYVVETARKDGNIVYEVKE